MLTHKPSTSVLLLQAARGRAPSPSQKQQRCQQSWRAARLQALRSICWTSCLRVMLAISGHMRSMFPCRLARLAHRSRLLQASRTGAHARPVPAMCCDFQNNPGITRIVLRPISCTQVTPGRCHCQVTAQTSVWADNSTHCMLYAA